MRPTAGFTTSLVVFAALSFGSIVGCTSPNPEFHTKDVTDEVGSGEMPDAFVKTNSGTAPDLAPGWGGSCSDGIKNGDQTDIDCGGACKPCKRGLMCRSGEDCESGLCINQTCVTNAPPNTCTNEEMDGTETDIDCGGDCLPCYNRDGCAASADCWSRLCANNVCLGGPERPLGPKPDGGTP